MNCSLFLGKPLTTDEQQTFETRFIHQTDITYYRNLKKYYMENIESRRVQGLSYSDIKLQVHEHVRQIQE
ncbi:hypothetical protein UR08_08670 [Listeria kieliensis]|uniref:Uncharacterized protein n=1 Tax=Listeria kieliensis TaxID=1621700 RepID=A0A3D8TRI9_9LIST|nr:hypothetical protein UR08_08670 [Listeria kieliensis]